MQAAAMLQHKGCFQGKYGTVTVVSEGRYQLTWGFVNQLGHKQGASYPTVLSHPVCLFVH